MGEKSVEIHARLTAWKQTPEASRVSLRALAAQIGTSHQLLSFHLRRWDQWQMKEHRRMALEIRACAKAENRPLTRFEEAQVAYYDRAAFNLMIDGIISKKFDELRDQVMRGNLKGLEMLKFLASKGYRNAREILHAVVSGGETPK